MPWRKCCPVGSLGRGPGVGGRGADAPLSLPCWALEKALTSWFCERGDGYLWLCGGGRWGGGERAAGG